MRFRFVHLTLIVFACFALSLSAAAEQPPVLTVDCETGLPLPDSNTSMSVDVPDALEIDLGLEKEWRDDCWTENRWVSAGCCTKSWGQAYKERLQERHCCLGTGCGGWQNTSTTNCTSFPC